MPHSHVSPSDWRWLVLWLICVVPAAIGRPCAEDEFTCATGTCLPASHVCDFTEQCGDGGDEHHCFDWDRCDFESDFCDLTQSDNSQFAWARKTGEDGIGPKWDHRDSQTAHFLSMTYKGGKQPLATLRSSFFLPTGVRQRCQVTFYYHLPPQDGALSVGLQTHQGGPVQEVWRQTEAQKERWTRTTVTIESRDRFQLLLQGRRSKLLPSSETPAIDDISFSNGCVPEVADACDFESGQCGWTSTGLGTQIQWHRSRAGDSPLGGAAPLNDHSVNSSEGHFIWMATNRSSEPVTASLESATYRAGAKCALRFYYSMAGDNRLRVWAQMPQGLKKRLATLAPTDGLWVGEELPLPPCLAQFQIHFEGVLGDPLGFLALDTIEIINCAERGEPASCPKEFDASQDGPNAPSPTRSPALCPPAFFTCHTGECIPGSQVCDFTEDCPGGDDEEQCAAACDFEGGSCGWYENAPGDGFDWIWGSRVALQPDYQDQAPPQDHSTDTSKGHSMFVVKTTKSLSQKAELRSPKFRQSASGCTLSFWHYNYGQAVGAADMYLRVDGVNNNTVVWRTLYDQGSRWLRVLIQLGRLTRPFHFSLTKLSLGVFDGVSALDDIRFEDCALPPPVPVCQGQQHFHCRDTKACIDRLLVCDLTDDCGDTSDEDHCAQGLQCDFEDGLCNWTQDDVDNFDWTRIQGPTPTAKTGPWKDHSLGTVLGHYLYIETSAPQAFRDTAVLLSPNFGPTAHQACIFRFHYHMFGQHVYKLAVYKRTSRDAQGLLLWAQYGEQGNLWLRETLHIRSSQPFQVLVEGTVGDDLNGDIAIDDLSFMDCLLYDGDLPSAGLTTPWGSSGPPTEAPNNCSHEQFACQETGRCIDAGRRCDFRGDCADESDEVTCVQPLCNFEGGLMCGWHQNTSTSSEAEHPFQWFIGQGASLHPGEENHRPAWDHSSASHDGFYVYADSSNGAYGAIADLLTPLISRTGPQCTLTFWYHMNGITVGTLQVLIISGGVTQDLWALSGSQGNSWKKGEVFLGTRDKFQIILRAKRGISYIGDVTLDDVAFEDCAPLLTPDRQCHTDEFTCANDFCISKDNLCDFSDHCGDASDEDPRICGHFYGRCDFEFDLCSWRQWQGDDFDWLLRVGSTPTLGTGPSADHTLQDPSGHYIYVESSFPQTVGNVAKLSSLTISRLSRDCKLIFYVHMAGRSMGSLLVYQVTVSNQQRQLLNLTGDQGNYWQRRQLALHADEDFMVLIEGQVGKGGKGDISLDDITFTGECLPAASASSPAPPTSSPPHGLCPSGYLQCHGGGCYTPRQRCNFVDDCVDGTDEEECGTSCDFEHGRCGWKNSLADNFDWVIGLGSLQSLRPPVDHTLGTQNGHFAYLEATPAGLRGDKAHMKSSRWTESSGTCRLTFWYFMSPKATGIIRLYVKTDHGLSEVWNKTGSPGDTWVKAEVPLRRLRDFEIIFEGVRSKDFGGGAAIDDIRFESCQPGDEVPGLCLLLTDFMCANKQCIDSHLVCDYKADCDDGSDEVDCGDVHSVPGTCDFNVPEGESWESSCHLHQDENDDFDWTISSGVLDTGHGPVTDHGGKGRFIYINSVAQKEGSVAIISTWAQFPASVGMCHVRFFYYMHGSKQIRTLKVYTATDAGMNLLMWSTSGNQGGTWKYANIIVSNYKPFRVTFVAEVGVDGDTDIALDDISFSKECITQGVVTLPPPTCSLESFQCQLVPQCISSTWQCDGEADCVDGSDEFCPTKMPGTLGPQDRCHSSEFQCRSGQCIPSLLRCDGVADCQGAEDEFACPVKLCLNDSLLCEDTHDCVPPSQRCDGTVDCVSFQPDESSCTECPTGYCRNGGTCALGRRGPSCHCPPNWRGNRCHLKRKTIPPSTSVPLSPHMQTDVFAVVSAGLTLLVFAAAGASLLFCKKRLAPGKGPGMECGAAHGRGEAEMPRSGAIPAINISVYPWLEHPQGNEKMKKEKKKVSPPQSFANPLYDATTLTVGPVAGSSEA
ncbi:MAM and LDL-receptor class A domain-containing protein 1 isoform X1 [Erpetoichthys calabaricus]|uniref:MAM and LDL-receptor class A domain-containing protein 1 isoform X1 n=1 Tax=Erpetoichthys calabaricus TaxID=27687 RepID=UPI00223487B8|nr:MAM and LDL-receptor class A domain-containing protein 1 isoform X1 [Erpetoichthys calabaricus]